MLLTFQNFFLLGLGETWCLSQPASSLCLQELPLPFKPSPQTCALKLFLATRKAIAVASTTGVALLKHER